MIRPTPWDRIIPTDLVELASGTHLTLCTILALPIPYRKHALPGSIESPPTWRHQLTIGINKNFFMSVVSQLRGDGGVAYTWMTKTVSNIYVWLALLGDSIVLLPVLPHIAIHWKGHIPHSALCHTVPTLGPNPSCVHSFSQTLSSISLSSPQELDGKSSGGYFVGAVCYHLYHPHFHNLRIAELSC